MKATPVSINDNGVFVYDLSPFRRQDVFAWEDVLTWYEITIVTTQDLTGWGKWRTAVKTVDSQQCPRWYFVTGTAADVKATLKKGSTPDAELSQPQ